jgi:hypothetical protein|tara:strand:- start:3901 stop:4392 length:492 start_codon:yes stop_codon:yes gene_type:complete
MIKYKFFLCLAILVFSNCQESISKSEKIISEFSDTTNFDQNLIILESAASSSINDSMWIRYMIASGDYQAQIPGRALFAIRNYMAVYDSLPSRPEAPLSLFTAAIVFGEELDDHPRAIQTLGILIDTYPETKYARRGSEYREVLIFGKDSSLIERIHKWQQTP